MILNDQPLEIYFFLLFLYNADLSDTIQMIEMTINSAAITKITIPRVSSVSVGCISCNIIKMEIHTPL
jgi:hypothetical protein